MLRSRRAQRDDKRYARALPEEVELTETYQAEQEISQNPSTRLVGAAKGRIEVRVPYDGRGFFTRQAIADVEHGSEPSAEPATIGHLLLVDHARTAGLGSAMQAHNQVGSIPLRVPVASPDGSLDLAGDRRACVLTYDYRPDDPHLLPIDLDVQFDDRDSLTGSFVPVQSLGTRGREDPSWVIEKLRQEATFSSELLLRFVVRVSIPVKAGMSALEPVVRDISVSWPTLTSLRSTRLHLENLDADGSGDPFRAAAVRYNPVDKRLEWRGVRMRELRGVPVGESGTRVYASALSLLEIGHPGELYQQETLEVNATVEIPNYLLSGMEARLFDATGRQQRRQPELMTTLKVQTTVFPADVFAGRAFSPYRQFVFDDIIPDEMRINDIMTVLRNSKFTVDPPLSPATSDPAARTWLLLAHRAQGPDSLSLLVAVEGRRAVLDREQLMGASVKISGSKDSGQLKISVLGTLPRNHQELTREMNAFQRALRDRFQFHQTSRK